jgi:hypothetical protein
MSIPILLTGAGVAMFLIGLSSRPAQFPSSLLTIAVAATTFALVAAFVMFVVPLTPWGHQSFVSKGTVFVLSVLMTPILFCSVVVSAVLWPYVVGRFVGHFTQRTAKP